MDALEGGGKFRKHGLERRVDKPASGDDHVIMAGPGRFGGDTRRGVAQAASDAVAHHGVADLARDGEADPDERVGIRAIAGLERQEAGMGARAAGCGFEIRAPSQAIEPRGLRGVPHG